VLMQTGPVFGNGRFPAANQIVFSPSDPNLVVARTTYAVLPSDDNGTTWTYLCEDALGLPSTAYQDPALGLTANNALVAGLSMPTAGIDVSTDLGCDWNCIGGALAGQSVVDVVVRADNPHVVLALTSTFLPADAGGGTFSQVFQSVDDGAAWTAIGVPVDADVRVQTLDVTKLDPHRIYVSGTRGFGSTRTASLFISADDAQHWTESPLAQFDGSIEDSIYIGAVDPADAARVYVRSSAAPAGGQSRLFVTGDSGQSFQVAEQFQVPPPSLGIAAAGEILGFALSPDGTKIYAGTKEAGLFVASKTDMSFVKTSSIHVQCLAARGAELWACSDEVSGFVVGVSTDDGATFTAKLPAITSLSGPIACAGATPAGSLACGATVNGSQCLNSFHLFCQTDDPRGRCGGNPIDGGSAMDAGGGGGAADAGGQPVAASGSARSSSCGCALTGRQRENAAGFLAWCAAAALGLRRRRVGARRSGRD
jgi:hypothetical protein